MAKLRPISNLNMFAPSPTDLPAPVPETLISSPASVPIKDPCAKCGGRSQATRYPQDHGGYTRYCVAGCLSEDRTDAYYFTPVVESFAEAAEREGAKKIVQREVVSPDEPERPTLSDDKLETVVVCLTEEALAAFVEPSQAALIETGERWEEAWGGMPEFKQDDLAPWKSIYVHFESREDMEKFAKLVKQTITLNTRSIWFPEAEIGRLATKKYVEGPVDTRTKKDALR